MIPHFTLVSMTALGTVDIVYNGQHHHFLDRWRLLYSTGIVQLGLLTMMKRRQFVSVHNRQV